MRSVLRSDRSARSTGSPIRNEATTPGRSIRDSARSKRDERNSR